MIKPKKIKPILWIIMPLLLISFVSAQTVILGDGDSIIPRVRLGIQDLYCRLTGCTMKGDINMDNNSIINANFINTTFTTITEANVTGNLQVDGNVTADYFFGDGSFLTGLMNDTDCNATGSCSNVVYMDYNNNLSEFTDRELRIVSYDAQTATFTAIGKADGGSAQIAVERQDPSPNDGDYIGDFAFWSYDNTKFPVKYAWIEAYSDEITANFDGRMRLAVLKDSVPSYLLTLQGDNVTVGGNLLVDDNVTAQNYCNATDCYTVTDFLNQSIDTNTHVAGDGVYLYNDSTTMYFNETKLNNTGDDRWVNVDGDIMTGNLAIQDSGNQPLILGDGTNDNFNLFFNGSTNDGVISYSGSTKTFFINGNNNAGPSDYGSVWIGSSATPLTLGNGAGATTMKILFDGASNNGELRFYDAGYFEFDIDTRFEDELRIDQDTGSTAFELNPGGSGESFRMESLGGQGTYFSTQDGSYRNNLHLTTDGSESFFGHPNTAYPQFWIHADANANRYLGLYHNVTDSVIISGTGTVYIQPNITTNCVTFIDGTVQCTAPTDINLSELNETYVLKSGDVMTGDLNGTNFNVPLNLETSNKLLYDDGASKSLDWRNHELWSAGTKTLDWSNQFLYDNTGTNSIDWNGRTLYDSSGGQNINYLTSGQTQFYGTLCNATGTCFSLTELNKTAAPIDLTNYINTTQFDNATIIRDHNITWIHKNQLFNTSNEIFNVVDNNTFIKFGDISSNSYGNLYMVTPFETPIPTRAVYERLNGTTNSTQLLNFVMNDNMSLQYTGTSSQEFLVTIDAGIDFNQDGKPFSLLLAKNGAIINESRINTIVQAKDENVLYSLNHIVELNTNDYIELYGTYFEVDGKTVTINNLDFSITAIGGVKGEQGEQGVINETAINNTIDAKINAYNITVDDNYVNEAGDTMTGNLSMNGGDIDFIDGRYILDHGANFVSGDTSPSVATSNFYKTANLVSTTITDLDDEEDGQVVHILINDANTKFSAAPVGNFILKDGVDFTAATFDTISFIYDSASTRWWEIARESPTVGEPDTNCSVIGSCPNIAYLNTETNLGNLTINGTTRINYQKAPSPGPIYDVLLDLHHQDLYGSAITFTNLDTDIQGNNGFVLHTDDSHNFFLDNNYQYGDIGFLLNHSDHEIMRLVDNYEFGGEVPYKIEMNATLHWESGNVYHVPIWNGHNDDYIIQYFIDQADDGDTLILGSGKYNLTQGVEVNKRLRIKGQGRYNSTGGTYIYMNSNVDTYQFQFSSGGGEISDMLMTMDQGGSADNILVQASDIYVHDITFTNTVNGYGVKLSSGNGIVENNLFETSFGGDMGLVYVQSDGNIIRNNMGISTSAAAGGDYIMAYFQSGSNNRLFNNYWYAENQNSNNPGLVYVNIGATVDCFGDVAEHNTGLVGWGSEYDIDGTLNMHNCIAVNDHIVGTPTLSGSTYIDNVNATCIGFADGTEQCTAATGGGDNWNGTDANFADLIATETMTIGVGAAGVDYSLDFSGQSSSGSLYWMEDEARFEIGNTFRTNDGTYEVLLSEDEAGYFTDGTNIVQIANSEKALNITGNSLMTGNLTIGSQCQEHVLDVEGEVHLGNSTSLNHGFNTPPTNVDGIKAEYSHPNNFGVGGTFTTGFRVTKGWSGSTIDPGAIVSDAALWAQNTGSLGTTGSTIKYGLYSLVQGTADTNIGVISQASGATQNVGGYFSGTTTDLVLANGKLTVTPAGQTYTLPSTDTGKANSALITDGAGTLSWEEKAYIFSHTNETITLSSADVWENVTFGQEDSDIKNNILHTYNDATNQTFTIQESGVYNIDYDFDLEDTSPSASDVDVAGRLTYLNGTEIKGSVFETGLTKQGVEVELSHNFLAELNAGDKVIFQFIASDVDVEISTHGTYGDFPESATILMTKVSS